MGKLHFTHCLSKISMKCHHPHQLQHTPKLRHLLISLQSLQPLQSEIECRQFLAITSHSNHKALSLTSPCITKGMKITRSQQLLMLGRSVHHQRPQFICLAMYCPPLHQRVSLASLWESTLLMLTRGLGSTMVALAAFHVICLSHSSHHHLPSHTPIQCINLLHHRFRLHCRQCLHPCYHLDRCLFLHLAMDHRRCNLCRLPIQWWGFPLIQDHRILTNFWHQMVVSLARHHIQLALRQSPGNGASVWC